MNFTQKLKKLDLKQTKKIFTVNNLRSILTEKERIFNSLNEILGPKHSTLFTYGDEYDFIRG